MGFALTILQRRLASSPEAIFQSLLRRRERLASRLHKLEILQRAGKTQELALKILDEEAIEDLEDAPENEIQTAQS